MDLVVIHSLVLVLVKDGFAVRDVVQVVFLVVCMDLALAMDQIVSSGVVLLVGFDVVLVVDLGVLMAVVLGCSPDSIYLC